MLRGILLLNILCICFSQIAISQSFVLEINPISIGIAQSTLNVPETGDMMNENISTSKRNIQFGAALKYAKNWNKTQLSGGLRFDYRNMKRYVPLYDISGTSGKIIDNIFFKITPFHHVFL